MAVSQDALKEVSKVFHFEFWLRYYFIEEREGALYITLTESQSAQMQAQFPEFWELAERVLDVQLSPELSQRSVVEHLQINFDSRKYNGVTVLQVLDSKDFSMEMYLFDTWIDLHEEQLMQKIYGFDYWMNTYEEWRASTKGQQLLQSLQVQMQAEPSSMN